MHPLDPFANRYSELRLVGRGGFGVVYRAFDTELDREVALKLLNPDLASNEDWRRRFRQEASAASKLTHPNITIVHDRGEFQGQPYIVMEFVQGEPLSKIIEHRTPLSDPERLHLIEQLCEGLHYAHLRNIVHRDVKPVNLVVREEHDGTHTTRTLKILDFGIAKIANTNQTATGQLMFTPNYVSPEQIRGQDADHRSDIFAVGAVAYELLVLEKAFVIRTSNPFALLEEVKRKIAELPHRPMTELRPDLDPELVAIVDRALEKDPGQRYRDLAEMRRRVAKVRARLTENLAERGGQTTVVLHPKLQAEVKKARELLEADDPSAALVVLEGALKMARDDRVRSFIQESVEDAKERQNTKRAERQAREDRAARDAIAAATAAFEQGDEAAAIAALEQFTPRALVTTQIAFLSSTLALIQSTEEAVARGNREDREAALRELEAFTPQTLVRHAAARLLEQAAVRLAEEQEAARLAAEQEAARLAAEREAARAAAEREAARLAAEQEAARLAAEQEAARLAAEQEAARLAAEKEAERVRRQVELARAQQAIETAAENVRNGAREARENALAALRGFEPLDLVADALGELQQMASARTAAEEEAERARQRQERERAQRAIDSASDAVRKGPSEVREKALAALAAFTPPELVADALHDLQQAAVAADAAERRAAEEAAAARAQGEVDAALTAFERGARAAAIRRLERFDDAPRVAQALERLRRANHVIEAAAEQVESDDSAAREAALGAVAQYDDPALASSALAALRTRVDERRAAEDRAAALLIDSVIEQFNRGDRDDAIARLAASGSHARVVVTLEQLRARAVQLANEEQLRRDAEELIATARSAFAKGERVEAVALLEAKQGWPLVGDALRVLRRAESALSEAERVVEEGDEAERTQALGVLGRFEPQDLVRSGAEALRERAGRRTIEEQELRDAAASVMEQARTLFAAREVEQSLSALRAFSPPALVADRLQALQRAAREVETAAARVGEGTPADRQSAIARLAALEPHDLFESFLAELRGVDERRTREEAELEARRIAAEAERVSSLARAQFVYGEHETAIDALERFQPDHLVAETLGELRRAHRAIAEAGDAVREGDEENRQRALDALREFTPGDLVASGVARLHDEHQRRSAAEREERERYARGVQAARDRIATALARRSVRAAERAVRGAELTYPDEPHWAVARADIEALRVARASEPSAFQIAVARVRRTPTAAKVAAAVGVILLALSPLMFRAVYNPGVTAVPPRPDAGLTFPSPKTRPPNDDRIPPPVPTARLVINALPWAEILEVRNAAKEVMPEVPRGTVTPFALDLPTGQYSVTLRGPQGAQEQTVSVTVSSTGGAALATFRIINPDEYFKRAGS